MSYLRTRSGLLCRFRAGDRDAMTEVYRAYLPRLSQLLRRGFVLKASGARVPGLASADDLADTIQESFVRAFKREARVAYDGERDYWPYLAVIARNVMVSRHRRQGREILTFNPGMLQEEQIIEVETDDVCPWLDPSSLQIARDYVSALPEPIRAVHTARYIDSLSQRDAAQHLGLSRPKVRKLENRLRRDLLNLLTRAGLRAETTGDVTSEPTGARWTKRLRIS